MKKTYFLVAFLAATNAFGQSAGLGLGWFTTQPSGGHSSGGAFGVSLLVGQPAAGFASGGTYSFAGGFAPQETEQQPSLTIRRSGSDIILAWPLSVNGFQPEYTSQLGARWEPETTPVIDTATEHTVTIPLSENPRFYRLKK